MSFWVTPNSWPHKTLGDPQTSVQQDWGSPQAWPVGVRP